MNKIIVLLTLIIVTAVSFSASATTLDFSKAITIGGGSRTVVEFTDPDCPFCRKASKYFEGRSDITRQIFFYPLARHPKAKEKVQYVLSQTDRASAYHKVMSGGMDNVQKFEGITASGIKLQEEQLGIAKGHKISSTPTFMINGRIIEGFDQKRIEEALGK